MTGSGIMAIWWLMSATTCRPGASNGQPAEKAKYVTGLSATVTRKDGHHPIIFMQCGPVRYRVDAKQQAALRPFTHQVIVRPTGFRAPAIDEPDRRFEFHKLYEAMIAAESRNQLIGDDVVAAVAQGRFPLVLTERTEHLRLLAEQLSPRIPHLITLQGGMGRKEIRAAVARLAGNPQEAGRVILATGGYIGEGFDDPRLDTLFLTLPVSWRGITVLVLANNECCLRRISCHRADCRAQRCNAWRRFARLGGGCAAIR